VKEDGRFSQKYNPKTGLDEGDEGVVPKDPGKTRSGRYDPLQPPTSDPKSQAQEF
jgi:hypothetical protein